MRTALVDSLRVETLVQGQLELCSPWAVHLGNQGHAAFYVVLAGSGWLQLDGQEAPGVRVEPGTFVFVREGQGYTIRDAPGTPIVPVGELLRSTEPDASGVLRGGGRGARMAAVFGCFGFGREHPLLAALPPLLVLHARHDATVAWVDASLRLMSAPAHGRGIGAFERRLAEALLIRVVQASLDGAAGASGVGEALDAPVAQAVALIHERPEERWSVASLARAVGLSRTAFATRFAAVVGMPPLRYLARRRLSEAARLLRESDLGLGEIAGRVGYTADAAFSRAFKRFSGRAPTVFRHQAGRR
jgi:AraC-like DNA-binding protein